MSKPTGNIKVPPVWTICRNTKKRALKIYEKCLKKQNKLVNTVELQTSAGIVDKHNLDNNQTVTCVSATNYCIANEHYKKMCIAFDLVKNITTVISAK